MRIINSVGNKVARIGCRPLCTRICRTISKKKYVHMPKSKLDMTNFRLELLRIFKLTNQHAMYDIATIAIGLNSCL